MLEFQSPLTTLSGSVYDHHRNSQQALTTDAKYKVLIVGSGVAGLVLGQILRANDIHFEIFEREHRQRPQGWSVSLAEALPHLSDMLPTDLGDLETLGAGHAAGVLDSIALWDIDCNELANRYGGEPRGSPGWALRPYRPRMREYLWPHMNVRMGKAFSHYTENGEDETVTVHFEDGTSATGVVLVGADGSKSRVRKQLLGTSCPPLELSEYASVMGIMDLSKEQYAEFCEVGTTTIVCPAPDAWYVAAISESRSDGSAAGFWNICWKTSDPKKDAAWVKIASREERYQKAKDVSKACGLPDFLAQYIDMSGSEGMSDYPIIFNEFVPPEAFPVGRTTLIGDAMHTMKPFRGAGANTAIIDAANLARILIKERNGELSVEQMLKVYETEALPRGREQVLISRELGKDYKVFVDKVLKGRHSTFQQS